jgi:L-threonylcarbamoyladenylate synthase
MKTISNPTQDQVLRAAKALKDGHLVAFPTETVYGLGADASNPTSVAKIYDVKGRPTDHPLIVHISSISQLNKWTVNVPEYALNLARNFWPGPMTLILKRHGSVKNFITGGQEHVGLRVPNQPVALNLLRAHEILGGFGIAAPSANRFGAVSPTTASAVQEELGGYLNENDFILDDGPCVVGIESTIIDCTNSAPSILRYGAITIKMIETLVGIKVNLNHKDSATRVSGRLKKHYSPRAKIEFGKTPKPGQGFIALASIPNSNNSIRLASPRNLVEFSHQLYSALRLADSLSLKSILVTLPEGDGLALAIRDRLIKAAGKCV